MEFSFTFTNKAFTLSSRIKIGLASSMYSFNAFNDNDPKGIFLCFDPEWQTTYPSSYSTEPCFVYWLLYPRRLDAGTSQ